LVGLTLIIDDFADISNITMRGLRLMESKIYQRRRIIRAAQCFLCCITFFIFLCITTWLIRNPGGINLKNLTVDGSLLVTSLTVFGSVYKKTLTGWKLHQRAPVRDCCSSSWSGFFLRARVQDSCCSVGALLSISKSLDENCYYWRFTA
jgi:hypothetical protein